MAPSPAITLTLSTPEIDTLCGALDLLLSDPDTDSTCASELEALLRRLCEARVSSKPLVPSLEEARQAVAERLCVYLDS